MDPYWFWNDPMFQIGVTQVNLINQGNALNGNQSGIKKSQLPEPIVRPGTEEKNSKVQRFGTAMSIEELEAKLGMKPSSKS